MDLLVIGSSNMDLVMYLPRIPRPGETLIGGPSRIVPGGKGANQAVAAARAGGNLAFITKTGQDPFGDRLREIFRIEGFPENYLLTDDELSTGIAQIFVAETGENMIAVSPGANIHLRIEDIRKVEKEIRMTRVILMQLEIPLETVLYVSEVAAKYHIRLILNPAPAQSLPDELLERCWLLTPNESEMELLTGIRITNDTSLKNAADRLIGKGVVNVLITLGDKGSMLCSATGSQLFHAPMVQTRDTTAAGDVFNGYLAAALSRGEVLQQAVPEATAAAAISVTREGAQPSIPGIEEVRSFMNRTT